MRFEKGQKKPPGSGMRKGQVTEVKKTQIELKAMIRGALDKKGGEQWLIDQMDKHPKAFLSLLARVLPTEITGNLNIMVGLAERISAARQRDVLKTVNTPALENSGNSIVDVTAEAREITND